MKTDRRHELEKNELADFANQSSDILSNYWQAILAGIIGLVALVWFIGYMMTPGARNTKEWRDYLTVLSKSSTDEASADALGSFGRNNRSTTAGLWALALSADRDLAQGLQQQFIDRKKSTEAFNNAAEAYLLVVKDSKDPFLLARANFGAAQAYEGIGDVAKAIDYYHAAAKHDGDKALGRESKRRLALLEKKETAEWYASFFKHPLMPIATRQTKPELPNPYRDLPDNPELSLPSPDDVTKPVFTRPIQGPPPPPTAPEKKPETPVDPTTEKKTETPTEPKAEEKAEPKAEVKPEPKVEPKAEPKAEPKTEPKAEVKAEPKADDKAEPKADDKAEPKI